MAGMDLKDMDTGMTADTDVVICIRIRRIRIHVPGGYTVPFRSISQSRVTRTSEFTNSNACHAVTGTLTKWFYGWIFGLFYSVFPFR